ncbi:MAG: hypothetical protein ACREN5_09470, partial [Gemmatimonadales bacterium]
MPAKLLLAAALALPALLLHGGAASAATNLVPNGDFSGGTAGWTAATPLTALAVSPAERLEVINASGTKDARVDWAWTCVTGINDLYAYDFGGDILIPSGQQRVGKAYLRVSAWKGPNCDGQFVNEWFSSQVTALDSLEHHATAILPADGVQSIWVRLFVATVNVPQGPGPYGLFRAEFDNLTLTQGALQAPPQEEPTATPTPALPPFIDIPVPGGSGQTPAPATPTQTPPPAATQTPTSPPAQPTASPTPQATAPSTATAAASPARTSIAPAPPNTGNG